MDKKTITFVEVLQSPVLKHKVHKLLVKKKIRDSIRSVGNNVIERKNIIINHIKNNPAARALDSVENWVNTNF